MKILHVTSALDPRHGGVAEALRQFSAALIRQGMQTEVATLDAPGSPWLADFPGTTHALGPSKTGYQYAERLRPWLKAHGSEYDCVISHGLWQWHGLAAHLALKGLGTPRFVFAHGMLDPWFKRAHPLKHLKKWLYWPWAEYRVLRDARAVFFTCEEERLRARESFWLYRCNEAIANLGLDEPKDGLPDAFLVKFPELRGKRLLLFLGRLHLKKGIDLLLNAFAQLRTPEWHLIMAGPGGAGPAQDWVTFTGMLEGEMKWGAIRAAEAFVLPSHQENFGVAAVEALSCSCPVLISDKVNIWREIKSDGAGIVAPDTLDGTRELLLRWMALDGQERLQMGTSARRCFEMRYQVDRATTALVGQLRAMGVKG